jgi:hypothetical protein
VSREPYGFVVIPHGPDGAPTGAVYWEPTSEDAMRVYSETLETGGAYLPVLMYRSAEVEDKGGAHAAEREAECPPKSSSAT